MEADRYQRWQNWAVGLTHYPELVQIAQFNGPTARFPPFDLVLFPVSGLSESGIRWLSQVAVWLGSPDSLAATIVDTSS